MQIDVALGPSRVHYLDMQPTKKTSALVTRMFLSPMKCTMYMVSIVNGPKDLLSRGTEASALRDGAAYVAAHWGQTSDGTWTPYSAQWV